MAITLTSKGLAAANTTGSGPYTATLTSAPTTNFVQLAFIVNTANNNPIQPTLTSTGLTWTAVASVTFPSGGSPTHRLTVYRAAGTSSATSITITGNAQTTGAAWSFIELNGVDTTGIGGANAIADIAVIASTAPVTTLTTLNLGGIVFTGDAVLAGWGLTVNSGVTPAEGFTEIHDAGYITPAARVQTQYHLTYDTTPTGTWASANAGGIALELKAIENAFKSNPKPGELVTVSDTLSNIQLITGAAPPLVIPLQSDTVALSDNATVQLWANQWLGTVDLLLMPQRADSLTLSDVLTNMTLVGGTTPNVGDSVTLTDAAQVKGLIIPVLAADLLTITENPPVITLTSATVWAINVSDQVTLTETKTPDLIEQPQPAAELVTLTDILTVNLVNQPLAADSTTLTDTVALQLLVNPQVAETVTLTDNVSITGLLILIPPVADAVTLTDSAQGIPTGTIPFDNFDDNAQNAAFWNVAATRAATDALVLVSETVHQLQITPRTNAGAGDAYNGYRAVYPSNYTDGNVFAEIPQVANSATTARTSLVLAIDTANGYDITQEAGQLYFEYEIANLTTVGLQIAYVPSTHRWWRIRHVSAGDTIRYETSPNGTVWTQQLSIPRPAALPVTSLQSGVQAGTYASVASPGVASFDNINATTLTIFPTDSTTLTDTPTVKGLIPKLAASELVTLTESRLVAFGGTLLIQRAESVTLTDFSEAELIAPFADSVTVTDSAIATIWMTSWAGTVNLLEMPHSAESLTVSDVLTNIILSTAGAGPQINVSDPVILTDAATVTGLTLPIAAADLLTLSDTVLIPSGWQIPSGDSITLTDTATVQGLRLSIQGADLLTLGDSPQLIASGLLPVENFDDNTQNTAVWAIASSVAPTTDGDVVVAETSHQLGITPQANAGAVLAYSGYRSVNTFDITNTGVFVEVPQVTSIGTTANTLLVLSIDSANLYDIATDTNTLYFEDRVAGITDSTVSTPYNAANHRWWRIRHVTSDDTIRWETSPNGVSWTQQRSRARNLTITAMRVGVEAGTYVNVGAPGTAIFDNLNTTTLTIFPTDLVTLTDAPFVSGLTLPISIADSLTVSDDRTVLIPIAGILQIPTGDSITLTDTSTVTGLTLVVSGADLSTLTDTRTVQGLTLPLAAADTLTLSDSPTVRLVIAPISAEQVTLSETQTINLVHKPSTADSLTLSDTITITGLTLPIAASDLITLIEDPTVQIPIAGVFQIQQPEDSITLTDTATVTGLTLLLSRADSVTLTDTPTVKLLHKIQAAESVTLTDTATVKGLILTRAAADVVTLSDAASGQLSKLLIARGDQVTLSDSRDLLLINQFVSQPLIVISIPARDMSITATLTISQTRVLAREVGVEANPAFSSLVVPARAMGITASLTISQTSVPARDMSIAA